MDPPILIGRFRSGVANLPCVLCAPLYSAAPADHANGAIRADYPDILAEHFLGMVAVMPAQLAAVGIVRTPKAQRARTDAAIALFLRALRPD